MDLVHEFKTALKDLYKTKPPIPRPRIELVASVAIKANKMFKHIVMYLEKYSQKIPAKYKLTALCVIDSIIRQSRKEFGKHKDLYGPRFRKKLKLIFRFLKKCRQKDKAHMVRILTLWQKHMIYTSEVVEPLLSIISPDLKSPKKSKPQEPPLGGVHSVAANALAIIEQQQTQIQALQQLQALKNLNSLTPSFVQAIQSLHYHQQLIAEGKEHEIPRELLEQLRLLYSLVQQSADPQPLDYSGLLRSNRKFYQPSQKRHEPAGGYAAPLSSLELPGISGAHPGSPRDRTFAPYRSINSNQAPPARRNHTSLLDDFDYGDDEDDAERIAAQKRRVELEKKRVEVAARARESARAREKNKRRKKREVRKKKTVPGNATPTQDEVDSPSRHKNSPRRYKNQDIDNELERLLLTSSADVLRLNGMNQSLSQNDSNEIAFSPISNMNSPNLAEEDTPTREAVSPISPEHETQSEHDEEIMEEYFARTPSNISDDFADENQPLVICTEEQKENVTQIVEGEQVEADVSDDVEMRIDDEPVKDISPHVSNSPSEGDLLQEDTISLPDSTPNLNESASPGIESQSSQSQDKVNETDEQVELTPTTPPVVEEQTTSDTPTADPFTQLSDDEPQIDNVTSILEMETIFPSSPHEPEVTRITPETSGDEHEQTLESEHTAYDPSFPTQDIDEISHASPVQEQDINSPYASSLEEIFPDLASSTKSASPSPSDISMSIRDAISPVTGSPNSTRSSSPNIRNPSPPNSPLPHQTSTDSMNNGFLKSIFDVALPFDNITPPRDSSSSSCISDVSLPAEENRIECVTPPPPARNSPLRSLLESVRERVKDMEMIEDIEAYESGKERRIAVTFKKDVSKEKKKILRSVIFVKNNKQSLNNCKSTVQRKKRTVTPPSSSSESSASISESEDSVYRKRVKKSRIRTQRSRRDTRRHIPSAYSGKPKVKRPIRSEEEQNCRRVRRVRSASLESLDMSFPLNKKDFLIIYTNIIKVEYRKRLVIEKCHLRKYLSSCVGDIELFDILNDRTAALIQLSNRKSADKLKLSLEQADFECYWVPGFKVQPGFHWDKMNGVSYIPWNSITDDPPYNIFSLSKGGTIDFIEIKKELELIDLERALEREKLAEMEVRVSQETDRADEQKIQSNRIRLCCQDSEHSDSSGD